MKHIRSEELCQFPHLCSAWCHAAWETVSIARNFRRRQLVHTIRRSCYGFFSEFVIEGNKPFVPNNVPTRQKTDFLVWFSYYCSCLFFHALECIVRISTLRLLVPQLPNAVTVNFIQYSISFTFPNMLKSYFKIYFVREFGNVLIEFQTKSDCLEGIKKCLVSKITIGFLS